MNLFEVFDGHLSVDLGAVDATVAQHFLDMTHRSPSLQHVGGKGMAERMTIYSLARNPRPQYGGLQKLPDDRVVQMMATELACDGVITER